MASARCGPEVFLTMRSLLSDLRNLAKSKFKLTRYVCPILFVAFLFRPLPGAAQKLVNPKVITSASVDCSSIESIVRGVVKPDMDDQQKLLALYNWFRRTIYHYRMMGADRRDVLRAINSYGCDLCGSQAAIFRKICNAAGLETRIVSGNGGGELGHTFVEVWYGGCWHVIDTMTSFYVLTRGARPVIASLADLGTDPTLVTKAEQEGRCGPEFLYCIRRRNAEADTALRKRMTADGMVEDIAWTLFVLLPAPNGEPQTVRTFWVKGPKHATYASPNDSYGARYTPGLLDITLKPHEEYVRLWNNVGRWMRKGNYDTVGPFHTCGLADEQDPVNFKYYEPYRKNNIAYGISAYRYYANGWLDWKPQGKEILLGSTPSNLSLDNSSGALTVADAGKAASLMIPVKSPYAVVETSLQIYFKAASPHSTITIVCQPISDAYNKGLSAQTKVLTAKRRNVNISFNVGARNDVSGGVFAYNLIIELKGKSSFVVKRVKTLFMLNMYSLPFLAPGRNTITVSAAHPSALNGAKLMVSYVWAEGPQWKTNRIDTRMIRSFPAFYSVHVGGTKMPRMKRLVMKLVPERPARSPKARSFHR